MRSKPHLAKGRIVRLLINQHQVGFDVAVPVIFPVAAKSVITEALLKRLIVGEGLYDSLQIRIESCLVLALGLALVVPFELSGALNRPHANRPSEPRHYRT